MERFEAVLAAYGADVPNTMARFMDSPAFYLRFLDLFFQDESLDKLGAALESGDLDAAFEHAHTLKGVSANMGLAPLYRAVCALVEPLRCRGAEADLARLYQAILLEYQGALALRQKLREVTQT